MTSTGKLANTILGLTYGDLMEVAEEFSDMCKDKEVRDFPKSAHDFAAMLHDWALAQEEAQEDTQKREPVDGRRQQNKDIRWLRG